MSKARKEAAKKKSIAQKAATLANKVRPDPQPIVEINSAHDLLLLGNTALTNQEFATAIELLRQAVRIDPQNVEIFVTLGLAYANIGQHDFALAACQMALQLDPEHSTALENRGHALRVLGLTETDAVNLGLDVGRPST
jgi:Flp pilus assembly protein TadD